MHSDNVVVLEIHGWHTQCGSCNYGSGGWAGRDVRDGKPILTPDSRICHGCGEVFTHIRREYAYSDTLEPIAPSGEAAA